MRGTQQRCGCDSPRVTHSGRWNKCTAHIAQRKNRYTQGRRRAAQRGCYRRAAFSKPRYFRSRDRIMQFTERSQRCVGDCCVCVCVWCRCRSRVVLEEEAAFRRRPARGLFGYPTRTRKMIVNTGATCARAKDACACHPRLSCRATWLPRTDTSRPLWCARRSRSCVSSLLRVVCFLAWTVWHGENRWHRC
jgi:hypothetical protein